MCHRANDKELKALGLDVLTKLKGEPAMLLGFIQCCRAFQV
jgi:hypothetical protein